MGKLLVKEIEGRFAKHNQVQIDKLTYEKTPGKFKEYPTVNVTEYNQEYMTTIDESGQYRRFRYEKVIDVDFTPDEHI